jgi:hypothetical protein
MITAKLNGGLGNQMFQIAAAYSLALDNSDDCVFFLNNKVIKQGRPAITYKNNVFRKIKEIPDGVMKYTYTEPGINYNPIPYRKDSIINGYFQSEKYFINHKYEIIELFKDEETINNIKSFHTFDNSVSVHVRRGDYLGESDCKPLPLDYYIEALKYLDSRVIVDRIYVFSDDIPWCIANFDDRRVRITHKADYEDLYFMSLCDFNIMSNSSFSWWGSELGNARIIIAPSKWDHQGKMKDVYKSNWILI